MHGLKIEQVTKLYGPSWHEKDQNRHSDNGRYNLYPGFSLLLYGGSFLNPFTEIGTLSKIALYPVLAAAVGFWDDWIKYSKRRSSDGLQKHGKAFPSDNSDCSMGFVGNSRTNDVFRRSLYPGMWVSD